MFGIVIQILEETTKDAATILSSKSAVETAGKEHVGFSGLFRFPLAISVQWLYFQLSQDTVNILICLVLINFELELFSFFEFFLSLREIVRLSMCEAHQHKFW